MKEIDEEYLNHALKTLEKASKDVLNTRGYTKETAQMQLLKELVKEQKPNENSRSSARKTR